MKTFRSQTISPKKTLSPGEHTVKINSIGLESVSYKAGAYHLILNVEGPDMGSEFEGFLVDKDKPTGPRYKGQIGKVKFGFYPFSDGETKTNYITINTVPSAAGTINGNTTVCNNQTSVAYNISSIIGATGYSWTTSPSSSSVTNPNSSSTFIKFNNSGTYTISLTVSAGTLISSTTQTILINPNPTISVSSSTLNVCI